MSDKYSGLIIKCLGGLYTVESPDGICECKARGVFRNRGISPCVGDNVTLEDGVITEIAPRKNCIIRPPLANLDQLIFIVSTCEPAPNYLILDKFIAIAEYKGITPVVVITKADLGDSRPVHEIYGGIGIEVAEVNYGDDDSVETVRQLLRGKISAFTGNSGAGKSTLLNAVDPSLNIATGEISRLAGADILHAMRSSISSAAAVISQIPRAFPHLRQTDMTLSARRSLQAVSASSLPLRMNAVSETARTSAKRAVP